MAKIEVIEKDNQFRLRIQLNFTDASIESAKGRGSQTEGEPKIEGGSVPSPQGRNPPKEKEKKVKIYKAQSGDGRKKKTKEPQVVEVYTDWLVDTPMNR